MSQFTDKIERYKAAAYPLLYVQTWEEQRIVDELKAVFTPFYEWSMIQGFKKGDDEKFSKVMQNPQEVLQYIVKEVPKDSLIVLKDFATSLGNNIVNRYMRDALAHLETFHKTIILVDAKLSIPVELEKDVVLVSYALPTRTELGKAFDKIVTDTEQESGQKIPIPDRSATLEAARGMTANEARNAFTLALAAEGDFGPKSVRIILNEKANALKKAALTTWKEPAFTLARLGGFRNLKRYLETIAPIFWHPEDAETYGLLPEDFPRTLLIVGQPGTGKSMAIECIADFLKIGLLQSDLGRIFGSKVGQSEEQARQRNEQVEAMAPVVDWWDEAEKMLGGTGGQNKQNPWEDRVNASLLTWLEQFRAPVLVGATVNRPEVLSPEMLSRFQTTFYVGLPTEKEKVEIFKSHCEYRPKVFGKISDYEELAQQAKAFNGREIRNVVQLSSQLSFSRGLKGGATMAVMMEAIRNIRPIGLTRADELERMETWARENNITPAGGDVDASVELKRSVKR
jgi:SpoVK/Ycf46/Vps4 family AAA+-type ATPase